MNQKKEMRRRQFLKNSTMVILGGGGILSHASQMKSEEKDKSEPPKINAYRVLGRTGFKVSDISIGHMANLEILNALLDTGANYIDTAESYGRGRDEITIGKAIKNRDRKSIFITSKLSLKKKFTKQGLVARTHKCLERLQTDYIDCMMIHAASDIKTIKAQEFHEAMTQLKSEGKVRYVGLSNHGSNWADDPKESMEKILLAAASDGRFDVMLLAYNFMAREMGEKVLKACAEKNIGTTLMKTNPVGLYHEIKNTVDGMQKEGKDVSEFYTKLLARLKAKSAKAENFMKQYNLINPKDIRDATVRFVLNNPHVNTVCFTYNTFDDVESYIKLSGSRYSELDERKLVAYTKGCDNLYCRHACGLCEPHCPYKVQINTIMRYNHYFEAQGREKHAMSHYAQLPTAKADRCHNCEGFCEAACPFNIPIQGLLILAHRKLTLA